ncbi:MAG: hypothetical protein RLZZ450_2744 [Pseudomonadota bacterium]
MPWFETVRVGVAARGHGCGRWLADSPLRGTVDLGAAFAVGGLVTWFVVPKAKRSEAHLGLKVGPGGVSMHGMF